jgi:hypothetical protein
MIESDVLTFPLIKVAKIIEYSMEYLSGHKILNKYCPDFNLFGFRAQHLGNLIYSM